MKQYRSAINYYNKAIELDKESKYHTAHYYKAACHALENQEKEAIESLKKAIDLKPEDFKDKAKGYSAFESIKSNYYKACFYGLIDEKIKAQEYLQKAVEEDSSYKEKAKNESAFASIDILKIIE